MQRSERWGVLTMKKRSIKFGKVLLLYVLHVIVCTPCYVIVCTWFCTVQYIIYRRSAWEFDEILQVKLRNLKKSFPKTFRTNIQIIIFALYSCLSQL